MTQSAECARIWWRCRRGIKELDLMLMAWVTAAWEGAEVELREQFSRLLELPDPELERCLIFQAPPVEPGLAAIIDSIRKIMSSGERTFVRSDGSKSTAVVR